MDAIRKKHRKLPLIIAGICILIAAALIFFLIISLSKDPKQQTQEQLRLGDKYLSELNYDQAIVAYRAVLEIDPKCEDAYLGIAEAYVGKGELQAAIDILAEGIEKNESDVLKARKLELEKLLDVSVTEEIEESAEEVTEEVVSSCNWRGGAWTERDDILPFMNEDGYMVFGAYEQDGNENNGPEPIEWEVLQSSENGSFLISRYVLDAQPFNREHIPVKWADCSLRSWLNDDFLNNAFTAAEQKFIRITDLANPVLAGDPARNITQDKIFLLNADEIMDLYAFQSRYDNGDDKIFKGSYGFCMDLIILSTKYPPEQKGSVTIEIDRYSYDGSGIEDKWPLIKEAYTSDCVGRTGTNWWLRTAVDNPDDPEYAFCYLTTFYGGSGRQWHVDVDRIEGIRPALYITE